MSNLQHTFFFFLFGPAVSKSLSFTEESLAITQIAETDVVMDASTTQIKQDGVESTVEIVVHNLTYSIR